MNWEEYRKSRKFRVELAEIPGLEGFWVDLRKSGTLTPAEMEIVAKVNTGSEFDKDAFKKAFAVLILDWNLTHPDTGKPLPPPNKDSKSLDVIPMDIFNLLSTKIIEDMGVSVPVSGTKGS